MKECKLLNDQVVVITGGAGLIGRQFSLAVAEHGGIAVVADRDAGTATLVAAEIAAKHSGRAEAAILDITDKVSVSRLIETLHERHERIDAVVNNAYPRNRNYGRKFEDVTYEDFCENVSLHLGGYFLVAQQFSTYFRKQGGGNIINMSSIYGIMAPRFGVYAGTTMTTPVEYAAIKSAVVHLTKYIAQYFKGNNIRVNCISPGGILDGQPAEFLSRYNSFAASKGMLETNDLQGTLLFLLSDMSKFVNGQNIVVDDGWSL
jgi:NAD(P)-dependent dehydrogenase (short-subunit alcohol dehydrogenase family)